MAGIAVAHHLDDVDLESNEPPTNDPDLTVHNLSQENKLYEATLDYKKEENVQVQKESSDQEDRLEVIKEDHRETTTAVTSVVASEHTTPVMQCPQEQPPEAPLRYEPPPAPVTTTGAKTKKHVQIAFPKFGRKQNEGDVGHDTNGEGHHHRQPTDMYAPVTITCYPRYLLRAAGILRIVQIVLGIIVCGAMNAEQCFAFIVTAGVICPMPSSRFWSDQLGGIGYVLFVGIVFILGNFAWIFYHIYTKPVPAGSTPPSSRFHTDDKAKLAELIYDGAAVVFYLIAASVAAWYASWTDIHGAVLTYNPYRGQWITATIFAWINTIFYGATLAHALLNA